MVTVPVNNKTKVRNIVYVTHCYRVTMVTVPVNKTQVRHIVYVTSVLLKLACDVTDFLGGDPHKVSGKRSHVKKKKGALGSSGLPQVMGIYRNVFVFSRISKYSSFGTVWSLKLSDVNENSDRLTIIYETRQIQIYF
jgi:hypothetical protein